MTWRYCIPVYFRRAPCVVLIVLSAPDDKLYKPFLLQPLPSLKAWLAQSPAPPPLGHAHLHCAIQVGPGQSHGPHGGGAWRASRCCIIAGARLAAGAGTTAGAGGPACICEPGKAHRSDGVPAGHMPFGQCKCVHAAIKRQQQPYNDLGTRVQAQVLQRPAEGAGQKPHSLCTLLLQTW